MWNGTARGETSVLISEGGHTADSDGFGCEKNLVEVDEAGVNSGAAAAAGAKSFSEAGDALLELSEIVGETLTAFLCSAQGC